MTKKNVAVQLAICPKNGDFNEKLPHKLKKGKRKYGQQIKDNFSSKIP